MQMQKVKNFATTASGAVDELLDALPPNDRQRIAEAFSSGALLTVSFSLRVGGNSTVALELGEPADRQTLVSVDAKQPQLH